MSTFAQTKTKLSQRVLLASLLGLSIAGCSASQSKDTVSANDAGKATQGEAPPALNPSYGTVTVMTFGPDGTLFVGDSATGKIHAIQPPPSKNAQAQAGYNLKNIDTKIAEVLGTTSENVRVRDLAIHPETKEAYLAVGRVTGNAYASAIVIADQSGAVRLLDPAAPKKELQIPSAPAQEFKFYQEFPGRDLTFTDLEVHNGKLYIAGLSNADFASTLWTVPAALEGNVEASTIEIYHAVHNQKETRAPIRTMKIVNMGGTDYIVAAYTCTPLVAFPVSDVKNGAKITGKTIAELGYGNTPGDIVSFEAQDQKQQKFPVLFVNHKNQSAQVIGLQAVQQAVAGEGMTKPAGLEKHDLNASSVPMTQILQLDDQDPMHLAALRRDAEQGDLELVSFMKGAYFRLSDFQSEYEIPGYKYGAEQENLKQFQNQMKQDEGHPEAVVQ